MKNTILIALFSVFYNMLHTPPLNQACLRKMLPWLEFQPSVVHARTKRGSKANQGGFFFEPNLFQGGLMPHKNIFLILRRYLHRSKLTSLIL